MLRFFKSPQPAALFVIPFITMLLWGSSWGNFPVFQGSAFFPLWRMAVPLLEAIPQVLRLLIMVTLVSCSAVYFNLLLNRHEVLFRSSYFPAFFYVLFSSSIPAFLALHPLHFTNLLLLVVLDQGYRMQRENRPVGTLFNAGLLIGCCLLICMPLIPLVLFALLQLSVLRSFQLREYLVLLVGLFLPAFYLVVIWFPDLLDERFRQFAAELSAFRISWRLPGTVPLQVFAAASAVVGLFSMIRLRRFYFKNTVRMRDFQQVIFILFVMMVASIFCFGTVELPSFLVLLIPVSVFATYYFISARKFNWYYESLFWLLSLAAVWNQWG